MIDTARFALSPGRPAAAMRAAVLALALAMLLVLSPTAATAQDVTLRGLTYDVGTAKVSVPQLDVRGSTLSESELRAILDPSAPAPAVERLQRLNAASASAPEVVIEQTMDGSTQRTVYRNVRIADIRAGVLGSLRVEAISGEYGDRSVGSVGYRVGETAIEAIDLPLAARVLTGSVANPQAEPMLPLYRSLLYRDYVIELPGKAGQFRIDRVSSREMRARPGKEPMLTTVRNMMAMADKQASRADKNDSSSEPGPEELMTVGRLFAMLDNFEFGVSDMEGVSGAFDDGKTPASLSIAAMRFSDQPAQPGFAMRGFKIEAGPARMSLAEFEARDFSFRQTYRAAAEVLERGDAGAFATEYMKLIPQLGTIRLNGFDLQAPDPNASPPRRRPNDPPQQPELIRASFKSLELGVANQLNGIPTAFRFGAEDLYLPLTASSSNQSVRDLIAAGVRELNLSWLADLAWRPDANRLDINALRVAGKDLISANITGQIGNVTKDAFAPDLTLAQISWLAATAQSLSLAVEDSGGFAKIVQNEARKARKQPDALRREWGTMAAIAIPAVLGDSEGVKSLANAVSRFIARPGRLAIDLRARDSGGIGLADGVAALSNPQSLVDKIEIRAEAR